MRCRRADVDPHAGKMSVRPYGALVIVSMLPVAVMLVSDDCHVRIRYFRFESTFLWLQFRAVLHIWTTWENFENVMLSEAKHLWFLRCERQILRLRLRMTVG